MCGLFGGLHLQSPYPLFLVWEDTQTIQVWTGKNLFLRLLLLAIILVLTRCTFIYLACAFYNSLWASGNSLITSYIIICSCGPDWSSIDAAHSFYNWYIMTIGFAIPTSILGFCNVSVVYVLHKV